MRSCLKQGRWTGSSFVSGKPGIQSKYIEPKCFIQFLISKVPIWDSLQPQLSDSHSKPLFIDSMRANDVIYSQHFCVVCFLLSAYHTFGHFWGSVYYSCQVGTLLMIICPYSTKIPTLYSLTLLLSISVTISVFCLDSLSNIC